jgi:hypothetical protein
MLHLQCDAVIEMRIAIGGRMNKHLPERLFCRRAIVQRELRMTEHPQNATSAASERDLRATAVPRVLRRAWPAPSRRLRSAPHRIPAPRHRRIEGVARTLTFTLRERNHT